MGVRVAELAVVVKKRSNVCGAKGQQVDNLREGETK
jgi:hypothetical protein